MDSSLATVSEDLESIVDTSFKSDRQKNATSSEQIATQTFPLPVENKTGMPLDLKMHFEKAYQRDFSNIRIFENSILAQQIQANAFTQGNEIHFAPGEYDPFSKSGRELIGHELYHSVQQSDNLVDPEFVLNHYPVNMDDGLEYIARSQGASFADFSEPQEAQLSYPIVDASNSNVVQGDFKEIILARKKEISLAISTLLYLAQSGVGLYISGVAYRRANTLHDISEFPEGPGSGSNPLLSSLTDSNDELFQQVTKLGIVSGTLAFVNGLTANIDKIHETYLSFKESRTRKQLDKLESSFLESEETLLPFRNIDFESYQSKLKEITTHISAGKLKIKDAKKELGYLKEQRDILYSAKSLLRQNRITSDLEDSDDEANPFFDTRDDHQQERISKELDKVQLSTSDKWDAIPKKEIIRDLLATILSTTNSLVTLSISSSASQRAGNFVDAAEFNSAASIQDQLAIDSAQDFKNISDAAISSAVISGAMAVQSGTSLLYGNYKKYKANLEKKKFQFGTDFDRESLLALRIINDLESTTSNYDSIFLDTIPDAANSISQKIDKKESDLKDMEEVLTELKTIKDQLNRCVKKLKQLEKDLNDPEQGIPLAGMDRRSDRSRTTSTTLSPSPPPEDVSLLETTV